jgi:hypothetical protein
MSTLAFPLKASSAVWKKVRRALKSIAHAFAESRMRRVEIEIDRYHRMHTVDRFEPDYWTACSLDKICRGQRRSYSL